MSACLLQIPEPHAEELVHLQHLAAQKVYEHKEKMAKLWLRETEAKDKSCERVMDHLAVVKANTEIEGKAH